MCERALSAYVSRPPLPSPLPPLPSSQPRAPFVSLSRLRSLVPRPTYPSRSTGNATDYATSCAASFLCHRDLPRERALLRAALSYHEVFPTEWNAVEWGNGNHCDCSVHSFDAFDLRNTKIRSIRRSRGNKVKLELICREKEDCNG